MGLEIPAEHKADTSGPVRSPCRRAAEAPGKLTSNGAGVPFLTGSRISITDTSLSIFDPPSSHQASSIEPHTQKLMSLKHSISIYAYAYILWKQLSILKSAYNFF